MGAWEELPSSIYDFWNAEVGGGLPVRWALVVEGVDGDSDPVLEYAWSPNTKTWHLRGMLGEFIAAQDEGQVADLIIHELTGDED